jgi:hypothetical protein
MRMCPKVIWFDLVSNIERMRWLGGRVDGGKG